MFLFKLFGLSPFTGFVYGGLFIAFFATMGGAYVKGRMDCSSNVELMKLRQQVVFLERGHRVLEKDAEAAQKNAQALQDQLKQAEDVASKITDGVCLDESDARRLRSLWGK